MGRGASAAARRLLALARCRAGAGPGSALAACQLPAMPLLLAGREEACPPAGPRFFCSLLQAPRRPSWRPPLLHANGPLKGDADHAVLTSCCDPAAARRLLATAPWRPGGAAASSTAGGSAAQAHLLRSLPPRPPRAPPPPPPGAALFSTAPPSGGNAPRDETASEPSKDGEAPAAQLTVTQELLQLPNLLSLGRLASAPAIAALILAHNWSVALPALLVSGASDWADGAAARRLGQQSVLGSYLDPLADKVLICCVIGALGYEGLVPGWVAGLVIARDVSLVAVTVGYRFRSFGWSWPGGAAFFSAAAQPMPYMRPLMISKVNTVVQLALVASCLTHHWMAWPTVGALGALEYAAAGTTLASFAAYAAKYRQGKILPASAPADGGPVGKGDV